MHLRKLELKDAPLMLEWMHDPDVTENLHGNFAAKTLQDCKAFIKASSDTIVNLHLAIASETDEYMGTVSLKQIDPKAKNAEFAITVRNKTMGTGCSQAAMEQIIAIAFEELGLKSVYWCVSEKNKRACRFYDKQGYPRTYNISSAIRDRYADLTDLRWYCVKKGQAYQKKQIPTGWNLISIKTIPAKDYGQLSFFEATRDVPFEIKRVYYISGVPEGKQRGFHAHKQLQQMLFCPYGKVEITLDNGTKRDSVLLDSPDKGLVLTGGLWREMLWKQADSVLCVAVSDFYTEEDYIRDYDAFLSYTEQQAKQEG